MAYRITQVDLHRGDVSTVNYGANPTTGDYGMAFGGAPADVDELDVDELDDEQALALAAASSSAPAAAANRPRPPPP
jgi:inorganic pyrophosphatase